MVLGEAHMEALDEKQRKAHEEQVKVEELFCHKAQQQHPPFTNIQMSKGTILVNGQQVEYR